MSEAPVALVTGGGTGIGAACCRALAAEGFRVAVHYRSSEESAAKLAAELPDAFCVKADLSDSTQIDALVAELKERVGQVDVLVNNAGYNVNAPMLTMKLDAYDSVMEMARGTWYLTKLVLRRFMFRKGGRIINGQGADTDIVIASAKAYINACNKILKPKERRHPQKAADV